MQRRRRREICTKGHRQQKTQPVSEQARSSGTALGPDTVKRKETICGIKGIVNRARELSLLARSGPRRGARCEQKGARTPWSILYPADTLRTTAGTPAHPEESPSPPEVPQLYVKMPFSVTPHLSVERSHPRAQGELSCLQIPTESLNYC